MRYVQDTFDDYLENMERDNWALIKSYVPEADQMSYDDALELAHERDEQAAEQLRSEWEEYNGE